MTQPEFLFSGLTNYKERQSENRPGTLLESMADQAQAPMLAEAATQDDGLAMAAEEGEVTAGGSTGHIFKKIGVETGVDGTPVATVAWANAHEETLGGDRTKPAANDPMDVNEIRQSSWSEAEKSGAADIMHKKLLEQMQWLCRILQDMRTEWKVKSKMKGLRDIRKIRNSKKKCVKEWMKGSQMKKVPENWCRMI